MELFSGSGVALITPYNNGEVDYTALTRLVELQLASGSDAVIVGSAVGESLLLTPDERLELVRFVVDRIERRRPVCVCVSAPDTASACEYARLVEAMGCDSLILEAPHYILPSPEGLYSFFSSVAEQIHIPIIIANLPQRSGVRVPPEIIVRLMSFDCVTGIADEGDDTDYLRSVAVKCPAISIYSMSDASAAKLINAGGRGIISTAANVVPDRMHELYKACVEHRSMEARSIQAELASLFGLIELEPQPVIVKTILEQMKLCSAELRSPLTPPTPDNRRQLHRVMLGLGLV